MNNRLQVGGLALVIKALNPKNLGATVKLVKFEDNLWVIHGELDSSHSPYVITTHFTAPPEWLLPLGDDAAIELYKLKEELTCNN